MKPFQFIISILFFIILSSACTNNSTAKYVHELEQRSDGRYYKAGEDKPFTGIVTSEIMGGEWEYITGTEVRSTAYYPNGKNGTKQYVEAKSNISTHKVSRFLRKSIAKNIRQRS